MANPLDNLIHFKPGQSGNPGGRPVAARNRLTAHFLNSLADDFEAHGKQAIIDARTQDPMGYMKVVGALMPKQVEQTQPLDDLTDAELLAGIALLRAKLVDGTGTGKQPTTDVPQATGLPPVS